MNRIYILFICFILTGCVMDYNDNTYEPSRLSVEPIWSDMSTLGTFSVADEDYVYYYSDELGTSGICRMNKETGTAELLEEEQDAIQFQLSDNKLFYLSFKEIYYGDKTRGDAIGNKYYVLKSLDLETLNSQIYDELEKPWSEYLNEHKASTVRGCSGMFYCRDDGFMLSTVGTKGPTKRLGSISTLVTEKGAEPLQKIYQEINCSKDETDVGMSYLYNSENSLILSDQPCRNNNSLEYLAGSLVADDTYYYDKQSESGIANMADIYVGANQNIMLKKRRIIRVDNENVFMTIDNSLVLYNMEQQKIQKKVTLPEAQALVCIPVSEGAMVLSYNDEKFGMYNKQSLYKVDINDFTITPLHEFDEEIVLLVTENQVMTVSTDSLKKYQLYGECLILKQEQKMNENFINVDVMSEICGDWLLIKVFDPEKEVSRLAFKIKIHEN